MTAISSWAVVICIAAVICGVLELLAPSSRMNGILRFVFGGFKGNRRSRFLSPRKSIFSKPSSSSSAF